VRNKWTPVHSVGVCVDNSCGNSEKPCTWESVLPPQGMILQRTRVVTGLRYFWRALVLNDSREGGE
jgi:hypothetical protein